jgi:hypothetical protein
LGPCVSCVIWSSRRERGPCEWTEQLASGSPRKAKHVALRDQAAVRLGRCWTQQQGPRRGPVTI